MRSFDYGKLSERLWDAEIVSYVSKIHEYKGKQDLYASQEPVVLKRLEENVKIQSTEASNKIEGIVTTGTRMKQLFANKTTPKDRNEYEIMGYRDVLNTIHENYKFIPVRSSYILQLHSDLLKRAGLSYAGKYKNVQNYIIEERPDGTKYTRFTPLAPYETPEAIDAICSSYNETLAQDLIDPLILISVFICDFLCIHPFNDGNGRMSRLLTLLLLYQNGFGVGKYISIEKQIESTKDAYYEALDMADQGWAEGKNDPVPFIKYMLKVILACYVELGEKVEIAGAEGHSRLAYEVVKTYISGKLGKFTSADVVADCPSVRRSSVLNALKRLTDEGVVIRQGQGRSTWYVRNDAV